MTNNTLNQTQASITLEQTPGYVLKIYSLLGAMDAKLDRLKEHPVEDDPIYTTEQAMKYLNLARPTLYFLGSKGDLHPLKKGKKLYFLKSDLLNYLMSGRRKTKAEKHTETIAFLQSREGVSK